MTRKYTTNHEWLEVEGDVVTVGITEFAQAQLGDVVFVELPQIGAAVSQGVSAATVESVKAASDIYAPVGGEILEINEALSATPALINSDPEGGAWFFRLRIEAGTDLSQLLDRAAYDNLTN